MCRLAMKTITALPRLLEEWVVARRVFDTLAVRDELRRRVPDEDIRYGDVFDEVWQAFRKGRFADYIVRTKLVATTTGEDTTVEYVPAEGVVLVKVRRAWDRAKWAIMERTADKAIARGDVVGPFKTSTAALAALHRGAGRA